MLVHLLTRKSVTHKLQICFLQTDGCFKMPMVYMLVKNVVGTSIERAKIWK